MLYHLLIGVGAILGLTGIWVGVQALARRQSPEKYGDGDVIACASCDANGACHCGLGRAMDEVEALLKEKR